ncbi:hypothetical protein [Pyruvatibacter sp.]
MTQIAAQPYNPESRHDLPALRRFLEEDDGLPFYTVNLYRFFDQAQYPANSGFAGTGREAFDRFSTVMVRLLAARASHPVYGSNWMSDDDKKWHRIVIVRYRSRRDIVDVFASEEFAEASLHKTASLAENGRMLAHAIHIPDGSIVFVLLALVVGGVTYGVSAWSRRMP